MSTVTLTKATKARWNNTGGDLRVHIVPAGTQVLVAPTQAELWRDSFQVTTPLCEGGVYHGSWTYVDELEPGMSLCVRCVRAALDNRVPTSLGVPA